MKATAKCVECGRVFDLADDIDADEWYSGHDCEPWPVITDGFFGGIVNYTQEQTEEDEWCEQNGHGPGCPHDPTDWDAWNKEHLL